MTSDKDKKIEAAANNYCNTEGYDEYSGHDEFDAFTAGANFGYSLAQEEFITLIDKCEGDIDFLKFKIREAKNETKS